MKKSRKLNPMIIDMIKGDVYVQLILLMTGKEKKWYRVTIKRRNSNMKTFEIILNGTSYGDILALDEQLAIEAHILDAGYESFENMLDSTGQTADEYMATVQVLEIHDPEDIAAEVVKQLLGRADVDVVNGDKDKFWVTASDDDHIYDIEVVRAHREITSEFNICMEIRIDGVAYKANANDRLRDIAA